MKNPMTIPYKYINYILDEESSFELIKKSIDSIFIEFYKLTGLTQNSKYHDHGTLLSNGEALTPQTAAGCIYDYVRTAKYLRSVWKAVNNKKTGLVTGKVKILYAGSGPFASLLLPLLPLLSENEIEIDIIDFHQGSIDALNSLINYYDYQNYYDKIIVGDATKFQNADNKKYDIILTETMRNGLAIEPQVAITVHLLQFLADAGILLPEKINITAVVADLQSELSTSKSKWKTFWFNIKKTQAVINRIVLGDVFVLDKNVRENYDFSDYDKNLINLKKIEVPKKLGRIKDLILLTTINIFDDITLKEEDNTGLTKIYFDQNVGFLKGGEKLEFKYQLGSYPKIITEILE